MAKKRDEGYINFGGALDPVVSNLLSKSGDKQLTPAQRKRKAADRARNRRVLDISPELDSQLEKLAEELGCPVSSLAVYLIQRGLSVTTEDELKEARQPTRSMRFEYVLAFPAKGK